MADESEIVIVDDERLDNDCSQDCIIVESDEEKGERLKSEGNKEYSSKNYYKAVRLYSEAIDLNPDCAPYYGNRAAAYMMIQKYAEALEDTRTAIKLDENFVKAHFRCAKCHIALGSANSAIRQLEKVQELDPKNRQVFEELKNARAIQQFESSAFEAYDKQDFRKVLFCMDRACALSPACYMFKVMKAEALALLGRFSEAQIEVNSVLRQDICNIDAIYVRGLCLYYEGNEDKAFQHFNQVLNRDPDHKRAKAFRKKAKGLVTTKEAGNKAFGSGKYQEAYDLYTEALTMDPNNRSTNAKLHYNRALVSAKLEKLEDSIKDCTEAVELDGTYLKAYHKRAKCYMDLEQYEEAVRDYEKICKIDRTRENRRLLQEAKLELKKSQRKDYYKLLGVSKNCSDDQIKKAYRKEALKHHPDRHSSATDDEKKKEEHLFKEVNEAYSILSDPKKRGAYDRGEDLEDGGMADFDANNIFQAFFGGGSPFMFNMGGGGPGFHSQSGYNDRHSHGGHGHPGGFSFTFG